MCKGVRRSSRSHGVKAISRARKSGLFQTFRPAAKPQCRRTPHVNNNNEVSRGASYAWRNSFELFRLSRPSRVIGDREKSTRLTAVNRTPVPSSIILDFLMPRRLPHSSAKGAFSRAVLYKDRARFPKKAENTSYIRILSPVAYTFGSMDFKIRSFKCKIGWQRGSLITSK